jgi:hypothetical protein
MSAEVWKNAFYHGALKEMQALGASSVRRAFGLRDIEKWIAKHSQQLVKTALGNAIANFTAHVSPGAAVGNRPATQEELDHWNTVRQQIHDHYGL